MNNKIYVDNVIDKNFIDNCDKEFDIKLSLAAEQVFTGKEKIIGLSGPTCSGKTTASNKLAKLICDKGANMKVISLDDFFKDEFSKEEISLEDAENLDFDSPDTMDIELLDKFIDDLFTRGRATKPTFDFKTGTRINYREIVLEEGDVFVFEGIQVMYPQIEKIIEGMDSKILFACPTSGITCGGCDFEPNEIRLLRRIVRDRHFRDASVSFTMSLWDSVRRNEEINIFPNLHDRCVRIDTTHPYELHILKPYLQEYFSEIGKDNKHYEATQTILQKLESIQGADSAWIGKNSLYKEFV